MNDLALQQLVGDALARQHDAVDVLHVRAEPLRGGISAGQVLAVTVSFRDQAGRIRSATCVAKELSGHGLREVAIHAQLALDGFPLVPRLLGTIQEPQRALVLMERLTPVHPWPWRDGSRAAMVLRVAADLHALHSRCNAPWDYEAELSANAVLTLEASQATASGEPVVDGASRRAVRRLIDGLSAIRRALATLGPFPQALIHGDLHPGNVVLAAAPGGSRPVLLDWGRARVGSPLEDVASWLQSLGCWEPEARSRHDTLLLSYLRARGQCGPIPTEARDALWLAGGTNALAGALRHQLLTARDGAAPSEQRASALQAVRDWLRIIRRAAAVWGGLSTGRGDTVRRMPPRGTAPGPTPAGTPRHWPAGVRSIERSSRPPSTPAPGR